jgi:hypothetical protein
MRKIHPKEHQYDCLICKQTKGNPCHITKGKNKGKIASSYHEWGRRHPPIAIKAYSFQDILNKMINQ